MGLVGRLFEGFWMAMLGCFGVFLLGVSLFLMFLRVLFYARITVNLHRLTTRG